MNCSECYVGIVEISEDSKYLAAVSSDKNLSLWTTDSWQLVMTKNLVKRPVAIRFVPNKKTIVVAGKEY